MSDNARKTIFLFYRRNKYDGLITIEYKKNKKNEKGKGQKRRLQRETGTKCENPVCSRKTGPGFSGQSVPIHVFKQGTVTIRFVFQIDFSGISMTMKGRGQS